MFFTTHCTFWSLTCNFLFQFWWVRTVRTTFIIPMRFIAAGPYLLTSSTRDWTAGPGTPFSQCTNRDWWAANRKVILLQTVFLHMLNTTVSQWIKRKIWEHCFQNVNRAITAWYPISMVGLYLGISTQHSYITCHFNNRQMRQRDRRCNTRYESHLHMANHTRLCCKYPSAWDAELSDLQAVMTVSNASGHAATYLQTFCAA